MARSRSFAVAALALALLASPLARQVTFYPVERVVDGDTVVLGSLGTIRLIGVDTHETVDPRKPVQLFGQEASDFLKGLLAKQMVRIEYDWERKDKYQRTLAYLFLGDGTFVNAEIIKQGYGHAYTQFPFKHLEEFRGFEREARIAKRGLWADAAPAPSQSASPPASAASAPAASPVAHEVYVTRTGAKYHRAGCRYLARSQIPMNLTDAAASYGACSVCRPPTPSDEGSPATGASSAPRAAPPRPAATSGRCAATTKRGTQCSRRAQSGRAYCWQH